jgi:membrane-associated phospholipid phosphatase
MIENLKIIFEKGKSFIFLYIGFLLFGAYLIINYNRGDISLVLNNNHSNELDMFFKYYTNVGDGLFSVLVILLLSFKSIRNSLIGLSSFLITGLFAQIIKHIFVMPRPKAFFPDFASMHQVADINIYSNFSMPSGHTATAFALFFLLALINKKHYGVNFFLLAFLVGMSRIYLLQHFFVDVYVGSIIGISVTLFFYYYFYNSNKINSFSKIDNGILELFRKK